MKKSVQTIALIGILFCSQSFEMQSETASVEVAQQKTAAEFPGGMNAFYQAMSKNIDRSKIDVKMKIAKGKIIFSVMPDGSMKNISVETADTRIKTLLENAVKNITEKWKPATENNVNIESQISIPLTWAPE